MIFISILILIVAIALPSINKAISPILLVRISSLVFIYAGVLSFNTFYIQSIGSGIGIYSGLFQVSTISQILDIFILIIGSLVLISWLSILKDSKKNYASEYSLISLFTILGSSLLMSSTDLISMYLSIELQSFSLYIISTLYRDSESSTSAGLKYFLLGGLSSCLILLGSGLVYSFTGLSNLESIYSLISVSPINNIIQGLILGFILIIVGFLFKISAAPFHNWAPDVYDDTPTIVTIWLTLIAKIGIIIFYIELISHLNILPISLEVNMISGQENSIISNLLESMAVNSNIQNYYASGPILKNLLLISSLFSLIIGTVVGLGQNKIKRLLAYSTISHVGFMLLALSINSEESIDSLIFYLLQYTLTNLNTFLIIIAFGLLLKSKLNKRQLSATRSSIIQAGSQSANDKDIKFISELKGQFFTNPLLSLSLSICLLSMAGIPPLIGFFSKQFVLYSAIANGYYFMSILAILVSIISASYYLKIIRILHTNIDSHNSETVIKNIEAAPVGGQLSANNNTAYLSNAHTYIISSLTLIILFFIFKPSIILNITRLLSLALFNF